MDSECSSDHDEASGEEEALDDEWMEPPAVEADVDDATMTASLDREYLKRLRNFNFNDAEDEGASVQFILMDTDIVSDRRHGTLAVLFGRASPSNRSINVIVSGWFPYMYIAEPSGYTAQDHMQLKMALKRALIQRMDEKYPHLLKTLNALECEAIISISREVGTSIMGYHPTSAQNRPFLKIKVASPAFIKPLRECFEGGYRATDDGEIAKGMAVVFNSAGELELNRETKTRTFNSNLEPVLQFMVDKRLSGCQWCQVPSTRDDDSSHNKTTCDFEILHCHIDQLQLLDVTEKSDTGSIRILSFDLEAAGRKGVFPDPAIDPVIQIGIQFQALGEKQEVLPPSPPPLLCLRLSRTTGGPPHLAELQAVQ